MRDPGPLFSPNDQRLNELKDIGVRPALHAEGVEEIGELAALRSIGCRYGQGFHFARPMNAQDLDRYLAAVVLDH